MVSMGGSVLLVTTATTVGLDRAMSAALEPWRLPLAVHDPGKVLLDLAIAVAIGGDCLADIGQVRAMPAVFGPVASDPTVSRLIDRLALDVDRAERRSTWPGRRPGEWCGTWLGQMRPITRSARSSRWPWIPTRRC